LTKKGQGMLREKIVFYSTYLTIKGENLPASQKKRGKIATTDKDIAKRRKKTSGNY